MAQVTQRWRPPSFLDLHKRLASPGSAAQASRSLDDSLQRMSQNDYTLENLIASTKFGSLSVTGSKLAVPTGLTTVVNAVGTIDNGSTAHNFWPSVTPSATAGAIDIRVWQPTSSGNNTPIAATSAVTVRWFATGVA